MAETIGRGNRLSLQWSAAGIWGCSVCDGAVGVWEKPFGGEADRLSVLREALEENDPLGKAAPHVAVVLDTDRFCLVPASLYEAAEREPLLQAEGIAVAGSERVVASDAVGGIVALAVIDRGICDYLEHRYGKIVWRHVLQTIPAADGDRPVAEAALTPGFLHLAAWSGRLLFAGTFPRKTQADLLYYLDRICRLYPERRFGIRLSGAGAEEARKTVARYFRRVSVVRPTGPRDTNGSSVPSAFTPLIRIAYENY